MTGAECLVGVLSMVAELDDPRLARALLRAAKGVVERPDWPALMTGAGLAAALAEIEAERRHRVDQFEAACAQYRRAGLRGVLPGDVEEPLCSALSMVRQAVLSLMFLDGPATAEDLADAAERTGR